jgi:hypothetical protein
VIEQAAFLRARNLLHLSSVYLCAIVLNLQQAPEALASIAPDVYQGVFDQAETARILGLIFAPFWRCLAFFFRGLFYYFL